MKYFLFLVFASISLHVFAQKENNFIRLSSGYQLFGTGDVPGYVVKIGYATKIKKNSNNKLGRLFLGPELSFENGVKNPKFKNPTYNEFIGKTFAHLTNIILTAKVSYYPFNKIIPGFNLSAGPSIGYSHESRESQSSLISLGNGQTIRNSYLAFDNRVLFGYRVRAGYDVFLYRKLSSGAFIQLANYNNGDFNTLVGVNWRLLLGNNILK